jgi:hypothetical protein
MLTHPVTTHTTLITHIFRTTESPIVGPARSELNSLSSLSSLISAPGPTRGKHSRCRLVPPGRATTYAKGQDAQIN